MSNLVYSLDGETIVSREATEEELEAAREAAKAKLGKDSTDYSMRSCWVCNPAHSRFLADIDDGFLFVCAWGCGRWYYQGIDITS